MLGLFSFRSMSVSDGIGWWMDFLGEMGLSPDRVTIHPDCPEWRSFYDPYNVLVEFDQECLWSDGTIGGYCTEFYIQGVEVGNIVNPLGSCLDCGFGGERLQSLLHQKLGVQHEPLTRSTVIGRTIEVLLQNGVYPSNQKQGYVLRRLIREQLQRGQLLPIHPCIEQERQRRERVLSRLPGLRKKHPGQPLLWFWETHGIHPDDWEGS